MLQSLLSHSALIFLSATLTFLSLGCGKGREHLTTQNRQKLVQASPDAKKSDSKVSSKVSSKVNPSLSKTQNNTELKSHLGNNAIVDREKKSSILEQALDKAAGASNIIQTAQSKNDWQLVITQYQDAIALLRKVRRKSINYTMAQIKIAEYQHQIKYAEQQVHLLKSENTVVSHLQESTPGITEFNLPQGVSESKQDPSLTTREENNSQQQHLSASKIPSPAHLNQQISPQQISPQQKKSQKISSQQTSSEVIPLDQIPSDQIPSNQIHSESQNQQEVFVRQRLEDKKNGVVFTVPIKRRVGGTPVIEVNFNGDQQFEMIVDTGASGTVITQHMAKSLGVKAVGKAQANTASAKAVEFPIGYVDSIETAGVQINRVAVAIAGKELEVGLLGHDFFGNYDLTIKRHVVELRPQSDSQLNLRETNLPEINLPKINLPATNLPETNLPENQLTVPTYSKQPQTGGSP